MKYLLITIFLLAAAVGVFAETIIPAGPVQGNWTAAGSPYQIMGDISVANNETLAISAGVDVIFLGIFKLEVMGRIVCSGDEASMITFTAQDTLMGWQSIRFMNSGAGTNLPSSFTYTNFRYGKAVYGSNAGDPMNMGGAVWASNAGTLTFNHCSFVRCKSASDGGAINAENLTDLIMNDCLIKDCETEWFGGICLRNGSLEMQNCSFINDYSNVFGACMYLYECPVANIVSCQFINNLAGAVAGIYSLYTPLEVTNSLFLRNHTDTGRGGGIGLTGGTATITNCTFTKNTTPMDGGAIWFNEIDVPAVIVNSIFWDNVPNAITNVGTTYTLSYCSMQIAQGGPTNIFGNPQFANSDEDIYTLLPNSPCVDTGTPDVTGLELPPLDLAGLPRIVDGDDDSIVRIDMGCFEMPTPIGNGELSGQVTDSQSQPVPGATVTAGTVTAITDEFGLYSMTILEGTYSVTCTKQGYYPSTQDNIVVDEAEITYCNFNLSIVSNSDETGTPAVVMLQSHPNPFPSNTAISITLTKSTPVRLEIYNVKGQKIRTLMNEEMKSGTYTISWDGLNESGLSVGNGIYLCRLVCGNEILNKRLIKL